MRCVDARRRAPQRVGHRTTLRVPERVARAANELAAELGTTPNDAIVRLAEEGLAARERRRQVERLACERRDAVRAAALADAPRFPSEEEMRAAMLAGRREP
jgi:hypothetical protein